MSSLSKPTHVSHYRTKMKPRHFPVITICPIPSFKKSELTRHGYANSYQFARGKYMHNTEMMGWLGHGKVDRKAPKFI